MRLDEIDQPNKKVVFTFGRLNPPHYGHGGLIKTLQLVAKQKAAHWYLFVSSKNEPEKNPLTYEQKCHWIRILFPEVEGHLVIDPSIKTPLIAATWLYKQGFRSATFVAGEDDMESYSQMIKSGNEHGRKNPNLLKMGKGFYFEPLEFDISARLTSATNSRAAATNNDPEAFARSILGPKITNPQLLKAVAKDMFPMVRKGMQLESINEDADEDYRRAEMMKPENQKPTALSKGIMKYTPMGDVDKIGNAVNKGDYKAAILPAAQLATNLIPGKAAATAASTAIGAARGLTDESEELNKRTPSVRELAQKYMTTPEAVHRVLAQGIKVEFEHTNDIEVATEIAMDHLGEKLDYYTRLAKVEENFADGKGPGRPGDSQRHGIPKGASISQLEKASQSDGRKGQLARWQLNMRRGKKKSNEEVTNEVAKVKLSSDPNNFGAWVNDSGKPEKTIMIPINKLSGFEPDSKFDDPSHAKNLAKIVKAIKAGKELPPILVRRHGVDRFQVLDGHHRFKAYRMAGMKSIPARLVDPKNVSEESDRIAPAYAKMRPFQIVGGYGFETQIHKFEAPSQADAERYAEKWAAANIDLIPGNAKRYFVRPITKFVQQPSYWTTLGDSIEEEKKPKKPKTIIDGALKTLIAKGRSEDEAIADLKKEIDGKFYDLTETREGALNWLKSYLPTWPEYVLRDWLYRGLTAKEHNPPEHPKEVVDRSLAGEGMSAQTQWKLIPDFEFKMKKLHPDTQRRINIRAGGSANPMNVPKDAERHATQAALAQQQGGVRKEPVIGKMTPQGFELIEGWHRTIQHFKQFPDGYRGPAWVAMNAVSEMYEDEQDDISAAGAAVGKHMAGGSAHTVNTDPNTPAPNFGNVVDKWDKWGKDNPEAKLALNMHPVTGFASAAADTAHDLYHGEYGNAAGSALGMVPGVKQVKSLSAVRPFLSGLSKTARAGDKVNNLAQYGQARLGEAEEDSVKPRVYLDMDGVLADFFGEWAKLSGVNHYKDINNVEAQLQMVREHPTFWIDLPLLPHAKALIQTVVKNYGEYRICSKPLEGDTRSEPGKLQWIKKHLSGMPPVEVILTADKARFAKNDGYPNILVDDYGVNINSWKAAGGIGIKYEDQLFDHAAKVLQSLARSGVSK